jgi:hypothetical protein
MQNGDLDDEDIDHSSICLPICLFFIFVCTLIGIILIIFMIIYIMCGEHCGRTMLSS